MAHHTLYLNPATWDITLDGAGHIATCSGAYAVAQNVANAVRLFTADAYYAQADGIPHFRTDISNRPSPSVIRERINKTARAVPDVAAAATTLTKFTDRRLEGEISITTTAGETINVAF